MESKVVVVHADIDPVKGVSLPGSHQIYKNPRVSLESGKLSALKPDEIRVKMIHAGIYGTDCIS
jgi:hypothetical protein